MLDGVGISDLILADRGYPSWCMFRGIEKQKAAYLIRLPCGKAGVFSEVRTFALNDRQWDSEIKLQEDRKNAEGPVLRVRLVKCRLLYAGYR